jgi:catechol-2,3-dioxygenase
MLVRGLGEIAFCVNNLDAMHQFYEHVIGLPLITRVPNCAFFRLRTGTEVITQVLALISSCQLAVVSGSCRALPVAA